MRLLQNEDLLALLIVLLCGFVKLSIHSVIIMSLSGVSRRLFAMWLKKFLCVQDGDSFVIRFAAVMSNKATQMFAQIFDTFCC
jgi:hypothetical protein